MAFDTLVRVFLIGSFVFYMTNVRGNEPYEMYIQYSALFFVALSFIYQPVRFLKMKWLGILALYALLHTILFKFEPVTRKAILNAFLGLIILKTVAERTDCNAKEYGKWLFWFAGLNVFWIFAYQVTNLDPIFTSFNTVNRPEVDLVGLVQFAHVLGGISALSVPFIFAFNPLACVVVLPLLFFGKSSSCVLAAVISFLYMAFFKSKKLFFWSLLTLLAGGIWYVLFYDMPGGQFGKRLDIWNTAILYWKDYLWFGYGLGTWGEMNVVRVMDNGLPERWLWVHNEFIQLGFELGLTGLLILVGYLRGLFSAVRKAPFAVCVFFSVCVVSFFHFPFHLGKLAGMSLFSLAFLEAMRSDFGNCKA